ncbi:MAG: winged helix-turn-helix domain-containing protein [Acidobacteriaceae bacterium]
MDDLVYPAQRVRFGVFEVDFRAGELWRAGRKRKLTGQPFAVLAILLEHPGEVVSREELQKRLWPDTFVDVDHNLNTAINKIREALGDSSEQPRFIETLPRRGYRFIAPVAVVENPDRTLALPPAVGPPPPSESANASSDASGALISAMPTSASGIAKPRKRSKWWWPVVAALVLIVAYFLRPALPPLKVTGITQLTQDAGVKLFGLVTPPWPLLTDGSRIYFVEGYRNRRLMQVSRDGGDVLPVEIPIPLYGLADMSPTRLDLLFKGPPVPPGRYGTWGQDEGLWALPVPGGEPRRIGNMLANDATLAPDGNAIYYSAGRAIFKANADGSQSRKILSIPSGHPYWLRISPDDRIFRFSVFDPAARRSFLWEAHTDGSHLRQLFAHWKNATNICCGNWIGDGKYFIFQATQNRVTNLWARRVRGEWWRKVSRAPVQLTLGQMNSQSPLPSKDGTKIFFIGAVRQDEIIRYEPKTQSFLPYLSGLSAEGLTFTADGKKMAYVSYPEGTLWESNADGSSRHELTFPPMEVGIPRWSPDGTEIAFSARTPGAGVQVYVISSEGGDLRQLTFGPLNHMDGSWSPDGLSMAFGELSTGVRNYTGNPIHILNLKTYQVTDVPGSAGLFSPRWSPDGRYLLAITDDYQKLMLYDFTTRKWTILVDTEAAYPNWSHDGKCVYFNAGGRTLTAYRVCLGNRKPQRIVDLSNVNTRLAFGMFGWWTGLGPSDSTLAARDISTEEIYALNVKFPR